MKRDAWLLAACALGPVTFFILLVVAYGVTPGAHEDGRAWTLRLLHAAALVVVVGVLAIAVRELKLTAGDTSDTVVQRRRFLAIFGLAVSLLSLLLVIGMAIATLILRPGMEP
jgi:hypothetical protein